MAKPKATLIGENGNVFNLMAIASKSLRRAGMNDKAKEMQTKITTTAKSYEEALSIIGKYVEIE